MNSLEELNSYNTTFTLPYNDLRPAGVTFDRAAPINQVYQFVGAGLHLISPGIEITSISNYSLANVRFRVILEGSMPSNVSWTTLPPTVTVDTSVPNQVTLSGIRSTADWEQIRLLYWNLPSNFESYDIWNLKCQIIYFDGETNQEMIVSWLVYDIDHYYLAAFPISTSMNCTANATKNVLSIGLRAESTFYCEPRIAKLVATSTLHCNYIRYRNNEAAISSNATVDVTAFALEFINSSYRFAVGYNVPNQLFLDNTMYVSSELPAGTLYNLSWTITNTGGNAHFASIDSPYVDISQNITSYTLAQLNTFLQKLVLRMTLPNKVTNTECQMTFVVSAPLYGISSNTSFDLSHRYYIVNSSANLYSGSVIGCPPKPPTSASATLISEFSTYCVVKLPSWSVKYRVTGTSATYRTLNIWITMPTDIAQINWGDGATTTVTVGSNIKYTHVYSGTGTFTVSIPDDTRITKISVSASSGSSTTSYPQLIEVISWGSWIDVTDLYSRFLATGSAALTKVPNWLPPYHRQGSLISGCSLLNDSNISNWKTHKMYDMASFFSGCSTFNQSLDGWNTSNVTVSMNYMFRNASSFNQSVAHFDLSNVQSLYYMFSGASAFNQPLNTWNTSNISNMSYMFQNALVFDHPLDTWDTSNVTNMSYMFNGASAFNQSLNSWNTNSATNMSNMFNGASAFNQPLNNWNTESVSNMSSMFNNALVFDQDINMWDVHLIPSAPTNFDTGTTTSWVSEEKPIWGSTGVACHMSCSTAFSTYFPKNILKTKATLTAQPVLPNLSFKVKPSATRYALVMTAYGSGTITINYGDGSGNVNYTLSPTGTHIEASYYTYGPTYTVSFISDSNLTKLEIISEYDGVPQSAAVVTITEIISWGSRTDVVQFKPGTHYLIEKIPKWKPPALTDASYFFLSCFILNDPNISYWNMSNVTNAEGMFTNCAQLNQPLNNWDTSKITNMDAMFQQAYKFDQDISSWDVHLIPTKPNAFDNGAPVTWTTAEKPRWGTAGSH